VLLNAKPGLTPHTGTNDLLNAKPGLTPHTGTGTNQGLLNAKPGLTPHTGTGLLNAKPGLSPHTGMNEESVNNNNMGEKLKLLYRNAHVLSGETGLSAAEGRRPESLINTKTLNGVTGLTALPPIDGHRPQAVVNTNTLNGVTGLTDGGHQDRPTN